MKLNRDLGMSAEELERVGVGFLGLHAPQPGFAVPLPLGERQRAAPKDGKDRMEPAPKEPVETEHKRFLPRERRARSEDPEGKGRPLRTRSCARGGPERTRRRPRARARAFSSEGAHRSRRAGDRGAAREEGARAGGEVIRKLGL